LRKTPNSSRKRAGAAQPKPFDKVLKTRPLREKSGGGPNNARIFDVYCPPLRENPSVLVLGFPLGRTEQRPRMAPTTTCFVVVAHQDDWQIFMGSDVYAHIRDPLCNVVIIVTTAGNGKHSDYHWKSRLSGAVLSICRALPSWSPYALNDNNSATIPCGFAVSYEAVEVAGKMALRCEVRGENGRGASLYLLHVPEPLADLQSGERAVPLWPADAPAYESWDELVQTIQAIMTEEAHGAARPMHVHAADPDPATNPGDHVDHGLTSQAIRQICATNSKFRPVWYSMYCNQDKAENLDGAQAGDQRCAIYAYGGGYMATAAGFGETWRTGWEREYPAFRARQYPKEHPEAGD
jgi:hypothetical protein